VYGFAVNPMFANYRFDGLSIIQLRVPLKVALKLRGKKGIPI